MTTNEAKTFTDGYSKSNAAILANIAAGNGCSCKPYVDWFTYKRWTAQGFQVQRGQKSTHLPRYIVVESLHEDGTIKTTTIKKTSCVFCRCQVQPSE